MNVPVNLKQLGSCTVTVRSVAFPTTVYRFSDSCWWMQAPVCSEVSSAADSITDAQSVGFLPRMQQWISEIPWSAETPPELPSAPPLSPAPKSHHSIHCISLADSGAERCWSILGTRSCVRSPCCLCWTRTKAATLMTPIRKPPDETAADYEPLASMKAKKSLFVCNACLPNLKSLIKKRTGLYFGHCTNS